MLTSPKAALSAVIAGYSVSSINAFTPQSLVGRTTATASTTTTRTSSRLHSTVDPTVITKKEYQDICGVDFDDATLGDRLRKTAYLYPKHVEVIDDFAPMVDKMVDEIVSIVLPCCFYCNNMCHVVYDYICRYICRLFGFEVGCWGWEEGDADCCNLIQLSLDLNPQFS